VIITGNNGNLFLNSAHGPNFAGDNGSPHVLSCQHCHAGQADNTFNTMAEAHTGLIADPSAPGQNGCLACHDASEARSACDQCHTTAVTNTANSLHTTLAGYYTAIDDRCGCDFASGGYDDFFAARCAGCHTTCGQCHISRPESVGGGFPKIGSYYSHRFRPSPDMNEQCTACHGSRVGTDFKGEIEGNVPDVHRTGGMQCNGCHGMEEIHGDGTAYNHRYEVANMPRCEDCHADDIVVNTGSDCAVCHSGGDTPVVPAAQKNHAHHAGVAANCSHCHSPVPTTALPVAQCQVCHSQPYKNCTNCHNLTDEGYEVNPSLVQLKIAHNPSPHRSEYDLALVRHTPIDPNTFANWGLSLPDYLTKSTWQYTSPHNVLRSTPQTTVGAGESCSAACHLSADGPEGYLLREVDLYEADGTTPLVDYDANIGLVIPESFPSGK